MTRVDSLVSWSTFWARWSMNEPAAREAVLAEGETESGLLNVR